MAKGVVKFWSSLKGYGFVTVAGEKKDIFVHFSKIDMPGKRDLSDGQEVEIDYENSEKGLAATLVRPL